jgi:HEAT repeat protein
MRFGCVVVVLGLLAPGVLFAQAPDHQGQVIQPVPLGVLVRDSSPIVVLQVERVVRDEDLIVFRTVAELKDRAAPGPVRHHVVWPEDPALLDWARPGKTAVCFYQGGKAVTCVGNTWYYCWNFGEHVEPPVWSCADWVDGFTRSYVGPVERLREHVAAILAGREVVVTARAPEEAISLPRVPDPLPHDWRRGEKGRVWRIKAGPEVTRPVRAEDSPDFVGWGMGGTEVVPAFLRSLRSEDAPTRAEAVEDLGGLGPLARPALPALRQALRDGDPFVRLHAVTALARIDVGSRPDLSEVREALAAADPAVRGAAVRTLVALGPQGQPAVPDLIRLLRQEDARQVSAGAAFALGKLAVAAPADATAEIAMALAGALPRCRDGDVRFEMVRALLHCGARAWVAVPALRAALRASRHRDRTAVAAADLLARLDPPAVEVLAEALEDSDCGVRTEIAERLEELGPQARAAVPSLRQILERGNDPRLCRQAAWALRRIDPAAYLEPDEDLIRRGIGHVPRPAAPGALARRSKTLRDEQGPVRARLAALLRRGEQPGGSGQLWRKVGTALRDLLDVSTSEEQAQRVGACPGYLGAYSSADDPDMVWQEEVADLAAAVAEIVHRMAAADDPVPVLTEAMLDRNRYVRLAAVAPLSRVDPKHTAIAPALLRLLEQHPALFWYAAGTLTELGPDARFAVPGLQRVLRDEDGAAARAAAALLCRIEPEAVARVWHASSLRCNGEPPAHSEEEWDALWEELARDAVTAHRACWTLVSDGNLAVRFLGERLRPISSASPGHLARLIADLDSDDFGMREKASRELAKLREVAEPPLRQTLAEPPSAEVRRRVGGLLERLEPAAGERLREARSIAVLEDIASPEARRVLQALAAGAPEARLTQEAKAALGRLAVRQRNSDGIIASLMAYQDRNLRELKADALKELLDNLTRLVPGRTYRPQFDFQPWYIWAFRKGQERPRFLLLEANDTLGHPSEPRIRITLFDNAGKVLLETAFGAGWRCYLSDAGLEAWVDGEYPLLALQMPPGHSARLQYYALSGDGFSLVRLEGWDGSARRNDYSVRHFRCGPAVPHRTSLEWEADLLSTDRCRVLRALIWLGGAHLVLKPGDVPDGQHEEPGDVRLVGEVRQRDKVIARLKELAGGGDRWLREGARLALNPEDVPWKP